MVWDFGYWFKPFVVFGEDELGLWNLIADGEPSISDVVFCAE